MPVFSDDQQRPKEPAVIGRPWGNSGLTTSKAESVPVTGTALIVDDESYIRDILTEFQERHGLKTHCTNSGESALALLNTGEVKPDIIFLDHRLGPGIGGVAVAELIRGKGAWTVDHRALLRHLRDG